VNYGRALFGQEKWTEDMGTDFGRVTERTLSLQDLENDGPNLCRLFAHVEDKTRNRLL